MLTRPFETENKQAENKNRAAGAVATVAVHALLLLALYFLFITPPDPPYEDNAGGTAVNFGTSDVGTGDQQQFTAVPVKVQEEVQEKTPTPQPIAAATPEDLETQENEDAPVVEKKVEVKKTKVKPNPDAAYKPTPKPTAAPVAAEPKPTVDKNALFSSGALGKPNKSKGDGEGKGKGDQGNPNGDPNSLSYHGNGTGTGSGNGPGTGDGHGGYGSGTGPPGNVRLTGRSLRSRPPIKNPCDMARGKVTISISVNRSGHVTATKFSQSGSTTSDDCLVNTARQAAMKYTFDENSSAAETQTGSILFIFKED